MDEAAARARCAELAESSPDRDTHSWIPRELPDGSWKVVRLAVPSPGTPDGVKTVSSGEEAGQEDPRNHMEKSFPPYGIGM